MTEYCKIYLTDEESEVKTLECFFTFGKVIEKTTTKRLSSKKAQYKYEYYSNSLVVIATDETPDISNSLVHIRHYQDDSLKMIEGNYCIYQRKMLKCKPF